MKNKIISPALIFILIIFHACKKDLNQQPIGLIDESKIASKKGAEGLLIGAYSLLDGVAINDGEDFGGQWGGSGSNWIFGSICGTEAYKGSIKTDQEQMITPLETFSAGAFNSAVAQKWQKIYAGVQRANDVLRILKKATDISRKDSLRLSAEARFLRGFYHFEAIKIFQFVPYVDESISFENNNYHLANDTLIWGAIENDFKYAADNLPAIMEAPGRVNVYAAKAFLAKTYIYQGRTNAQKFLAAQPLLTDIIQNGITASGIKYALFSHYHDNFDLETKNKSESVFAAQMSVNDGSGGKNGNLGDLLNFPANGGPAACCGFFQPSQYLVNHFKTDAQTGLPDLDHFNDIPLKNDEDVSSGAPFVPYDGTIDSRLDWTVGRRGIPYLDWGIHPGSDNGQWIADRTYGGPYSPIKNTYLKSQEEHFTDATYWSHGSNANNINLMRFADVLLFAAEVEAEIGSLELARDYVNRVRERANNSEGWVKKPDGSPAAHYKVGLYLTAWTDRTYAIKAIRFERMLELGMEGHRFFDLVRWGIADQEINEYLGNEKISRTYLNTATFIKGIHERFPIPQTQIDLSAGADGIRKLKQNTGY